MVFVAIGLLVGPEVLDGIDLSSTSSTVRVVAEATLALVLFADASRIDLRALRREVGVPLRLLGVGLPLTIALGAALAAAIFGQLTFAEALILAIVLAPTDAALGQAVVTEPRVPERIRQGLNVAVIVVQAGRLELISPAWRGVLPAAGAALAYGIADGLHGSGFIAAFVAGMTFRAALGRDPGDLDEFTEQVGNVLGGLTFVLFGAVLLGPALGRTTLDLVLYA